MNKEFTRNVVTLVKGAAFSQALLLLATPILSRLYAPDDFGLFALYNSTLLMATVIATGRYELAIVLPASIKDSANLALLALSAAVLVMLLSTLAMFLFRGPIEDYLETDTLGAWIYLLPLSVLLAALYQVLNYWQTRARRFGLITRSRIAQSISNVTTSIGLGLMHVAPLGLILGQVVALFVGSFVLLRRGRFFAKLRLASRQRLVANARRYRKFPLVNSFHAFVDSLQNAGVILVAGYFFSAATVGLYVVALRLMSAPLLLVGSSMAQVYYERGSAIFESDGDVYSITRSVILRMAYFTAVPVLVVLLFGQELFATVLGESWREAGLYAQCLAPFVFFKSLVSPVSQLPNIVNRQGTFFALALAGNVLLFASFALPPLWGASMADTLLVLSAIMSVYFALLLRWLLKVARG